MVKFTHRSLKRFPSETDDERNATKTSRSFVSYLKRLRTSKHKLKRDLKHIISSGKQFSILDCGAGEGVALSQLLSSGFGQAYVKKATGISLHSFNNVKQVLRDHTNLDWYIDDAFNVLPKLPSAYDFLVDMWGTYSYVDERMELLRLYHNVLSPNGKAYIYITGRNCIIPREMNGDGDEDEDGEDEDGEEREGRFDFFNDRIYRFVRLEKYLAKKYPSTFFYENNVLVMTKTSVRFPVLDMDITVYDKHYTSSIEKLKTKDESMRGNSWYPKMVIFKRKPKSRVSLRRLPLVKACGKEANIFSNDGNNLRTDSRSRTTTRSTKTTRNTTTNASLWTYVCSLIGF